MQLWGCNIMYQQGLNLPHTQTEVQVVNSVCLRQT